MGLSDEIYDKISVLLEKEVCFGENIRFTEGTEALLHEIAELAKKQDIYNAMSEEQFKDQEKYAENLTPEQIYLDMLHKIVNAPTRLHMFSVPVLLIPIISKKLQERAAE